jgi:hypothetical protein
MSICQAALRLNFEKTMCRLKLIFVLLLVSTGLAGCMGSSTEAPVAGRLLIDGQPIENVLVQFHPIATPDDQDSIASGISDADGKFVLTRKEGKVKGAIVGLNIVTLTEGPVPEKIQSSETPLAVQAYRVKLKHRPLPVMYERHVDSPLKVDVQPGKSGYDLDIGSKP